MAALQGQTAQVGGAPSVARLIARAARLKAVLARPEGNSYCGGEKRASIEAELARIYAQFGGEEPLEALLTAMAEQAEKNRPAMEKAKAQAELVACEKRAAQLKAQLGT